MNERIETVIIGAGAFHAMNHAKPLLVVPGLMRSPGASRAHVDRGVGPAGVAAAERRSRSRCREDADGIFESVIVGIGSAGRTGSTSLPHCAERVSRTSSTPPSSGAPRCPPRAA